MRLFYNLAIFYDSCSYLSSLLFRIPKTEFVSSFAFAFVLCQTVPSLFPSVDRALLDGLVRLWSKSARHIFEAALSQSETYQNIQDNPEYNSVLPFRIIVTIFAVNMLFVHNGFDNVQSRSWTFRRSIHMKRMNDCLAWSVSQVTTTTLSFVLENWKST